MEFREELAGERITLRKNFPNMGLARVVFATVDANREHLRPWLPWEKFTLKVEDSMKYLFDTEVKTKEGTKVDYGIYMGKSYIGQIGLFDINEKNKSGEIGYWLSQDFTGNGYMVEAVRTLEREAFENLGLNRILIKCDERNVASSKVAIKCGYIQEGTLRQDAYSEHFKDFRNTLMFSKLRAEFKR